jgi:branched-chain amino acid transport system substrate-binding protein
MARTLGLTLATTMAVTLALAPLPSRAQEKIKIGFVNTFSGPNAALGNAERDGFELALAHLGRKMGGRPVEVIYRDDQQKPDVGKQVTDQLIQSDRVDFLTGYNWSVVLLAAYKSAIDSKTIIISANAGPSQIAGEGCSPYFFSTSWQNDQVHMAVGEVLNRRGVKRLFIVVPNQVAGKEAAEGVRRAFKGEVIGQELTRWPGQLDFSAEFSKVRAAKPDAVYAFYPGAAGQQFFAQYAQAGLKEQIPLVTGFTTDTLTLPAIGDVALGTETASQWVSDIDNAENKRFVTDFKAKTGRYPSYFDAQAYDTAMLIAGTVEKLGGDLSDKAKVIAAMETAPFKSVRGKFRYNTNHFPIQDYYITEVIKRDGLYDSKTKATVFKDMEDPYVQNCRMGKP